MATADNAEMAQKAWFRERHSCVQQIMSALAEIASTSLSQSTIEAHIQMLLNMICNMLRSIEAGKSMLQVAFSSTKANSRLLTADFANSLTAIVPHLKRTGSQLSSPVQSSIGTVEEGLFWTLWVLLVCLFEAYSRAKGSQGCSGHSEPEPFNPPLLAAFNILLDWLLSMTRSPAWRRMRPSHGSRLRNDDLIVILGMVSDSFLSLDNVQPNVIASNLASLPVNLLSMICSIVSEQFGNAPLLLSPATLPAHGTATVYHLALRMPDPGESRLHSFLLNSLTQVVSRLQNADKDCSSSGHFACLMKPAVLQCCKTILLIVPYGSPKIDQQFMRRSVGGMQDLLNFALEDAQPWLVGPLTDLDRSSGSDLNQACLPAHAIPCANKQALRTDKRVLHALGGYIGVDKNLARICYQVQELIIRSWKESMKRCPVDKDLASEMAEAVVGLGRQCMLHMLQLMQAQSQGRSHQRKDLQIDPGATTEHERKNREQPSNSSKASSQIAQYPGLELACMPTVSRLAFATSSFLAFARQNNTPIEIGE